VKFYVSRASTIVDHESPGPGAEMVEGGGDDPTWAIEIKDLAGLFAFMDSVGSDVIISRRGSLDCPWLTIYDDYVE
jgi:hypothetical protein